MTRGGGAGRREGWDTVMLVDAEDSVTKRFCGAIPVSGTASTRHASVLMHRVVRQATTDVDRVPIGGITYPGCMRSLQVMDGQGGIALVDETLFSGTFTSTRTRAPMPCRCRRSMAMAICRQLAISMEPPNSRIQVSRRARVRKLVGHGVWPLVENSRDDRSLTTSCSLRARTCCCRQRTFEFHRRSML